MVVHDRGRSDKDSNVSQRVILGYTGLSQGPALTANNWRRIGDD